MIDPVLQSASELSVIGLLVPPDGRFTIQSRQSLSWGPDPLRGRSTYVLGFTPASIPLLPPIPAPESVLSAFPLCILCRDFKLSLRLPLAFRSILF